MDSGGFLVVVCRQIATRYDRLAANYLAFVQLAVIRLCLRLN
jgi:transposase